MLVTAALDHPIGPNTIDDWLAADAPADGGRLELIWGYWVVTPPPTGQHQWATDTLCHSLRQAVRAAGRSDLFPVTGIGVEISTALRTALIPDVAVLNRRPVGTNFPADALELVVEVWSPGNSRSERETKLAAYAGAGVPFLWEVADGKLRACRLEGGRYMEEPLAGSGLVRVTGAPVPVDIDLGELAP